MLLSDWFGARCGGVAPRALVACTTRRGDLALDGALFAGAGACDPPSP